MLLAVVYRAIFNAKNIKSWREIIKHHQMYLAAREMISTGTGSLKTKAVVKKAVIMLLHIIIENGIERPSIYELIPESYKHMLPDNKTFSSLAASTTIGIF